MKGWLKQLWGWLTDVARHIDNSRRIGYQSGKGSDTERLEKIELHIDVQDRRKQVGDIAATRFAAVIQPLGELGRRTEQLQRAITGSGALADFSQRLDAFADVQERIGQVGGIAATRIAAASQSLDTLGRQTERLAFGLSVPPLPRLPEVPKVNLDWPLVSVPPRQPVQPVAAQSELTHPYGNGHQNASLELMLATVDPAFADQFRALRLRSEERGPDWLTQATASARKLLLGLLHTAAPDERVLPWVHDRRGQLDQNGRPTRRTKIDWLCRSIQDRAYRKFVKIELNSALEVLELCNRAVHVNEFPDFEESFTSVITRVEFAILHIVRLSGRRRSA